jgi:hypothetical protein
VWLLLLLLLLVPLVQLVVLLLLLLLVLLLVLLLLLLLVLLLLVVVLALLVLVLVLLVLVLQASCREPTCPWWGWRPGCFAFLRGPPSHGAVPYQSVRATVRAKACESKVQSVLQYMNFV